MKGFLGTGATFIADLNLVVQIAMGVALLVGMFLARRKKFRQHKYCQSSVMVLNLAMIALVMSPSFRRQVEPQVPTGLADTYYLVAAVHAGLGTLAELLGLYIVLRAATNLLPQRLRFKRFKPWMRTGLALWWAVVLFGIGTYYIWYIGPGNTVAARQSEAVAERPASSPARAAVTITNFSFEPSEMTVPVGTTVEWTDNTGRHTVEADDGSFKSPALTAGGHFEHKFDQAGVYQYYCSFHGDKGMQDMAGVIKVVPAER